MALAMLVVISLMEFSPMAMQSHLSYTTKDIVSKIIANSSLVSAIVIFSPGNFLCIDPMCTTRTLHKPCVTRPKLNQVVKQIKR
jgi:hypothetical protein